MKQKRKTQEIRRRIMAQIDKGGKVAANEVAKRFGVSRQAVSKNLHELITSGLVEKTDAKDRPYRLKPLQQSKVTVPIAQDTEEHRIWNESVAPLLTGVKANVREICHYGFTEMLNNVIDHSQSTKAEIEVERNAFGVRIAIQDYGVGIWNKLQQALHLDDPRHALLELTKGKLTTDPRRHTGEGIFFTSRMCDKFVLASDKLTFSRIHEGEEWLLDVREGDVGSGTYVSMTIATDSPRTPREVFDEFSADLDEFGFTRTHLSVQLAQYEGDHLISRSQAKRILHGLDKFKEVHLDFKGVTDIGRAFADEIFRVFKHDHPSVRVVPINTEPEIDKVIRQALAHTES